MSHANAHDPALDALERLRRATPLEAPDPRLETLLRARYARRRSGWRWPAWIGAVGLASGVALAGGGAKWVRAWWYAIEVDGQRIGARVEGDGSRLHEFEAHDGTRTRVAVARTDEADGGRRTQVAIDRDGLGVATEERFEDVEGGALANRAVALDGAELSGVSPLASGVDPDGARFALYVLAPAAPSEPGRVVLQRGDAPARLVARAPEWLAPGAPGVTALWRSSAELVVARRFSPFHVEELLVLPHGRDVPDTYQSPDGTVRVRVGDAVSPSDESRPR